MALSGKRVLVTGATGFIGGALARGLARAGAVVTGIGRRVEEGVGKRGTRGNLPSQGRGQELRGTQEGGELSIVDGQLSIVNEEAEGNKGDGVVWRRVDVTDGEGLKGVLAGQGVVFHLAAAMGGADLAESRRVNVGATAELVGLAAEAGVGRVVHVSSIAAYGPPDGLVMGEDHGLGLEQGAVYGRTKAEGEVAAVRVGKERGVEVVVIRPGMVYGPGSMGWTVNMVRLLQRRVPAVLGDGSGHAQPVYIDNLVAGLMLAAERPGIGGEAFNFVDGPLPWREFFGYYGRMCGRKPLRLPLWLAKVGLEVYRLMSGRGESSEELLAFYLAKVVYPMGKAERLLGYRPGVSIEEGMGRTEVWLREEGYI